MLAAPQCGLCLGTGDYGHDGDAECGCRDSVARAELRAALEATPTRPTVEGVKACLLRPAATDGLARTFADAIVQAVADPGPLLEAAQTGAMGPLRARIALMDSAMSDYADEVARTIVQAEANEIDCDAEASAAARAMVDAWAKHDGRCKCLHEDCGGTLAAMRRAAFALARHFPDPTL